jgi:hypothetical protein
MENLLVGKLKFKFQMQLLDACRVALLVVVKNMLFLLNAVLFAGCDNQIVILIKMASNGCGVRRVARFFCFVSPDAYCQAGFATNRNESHD